MHSEDTLVNTEATKLLGLQGVGVVELTDDAFGLPVAHLVTTEAAARACPACGLISISLKQRTRPRHLPCGGRPVTLVWRKARWRCTDPGCARDTFTETVGQIPSRERITTALRQHAGCRVRDGGCTVIQAAREAGLSWPVVMGALRSCATELIDDEPGPVRVLGIDEIRRGAPRLVRCPRTGAWVCERDRWHVGLSDLSGDQGMLVQVEGRTAQAVASWLAQRSQSWRDGVAYVAIDMCTVFTSAVGQVLPHARLVVDHFHLVQLANRAVDQVRRRATFTARGRRGKKADGEWQVRRLLLRNVEEVPEHRFARMWNTLIDLGALGQQVLGAYIAKEKLRGVLALARTHPVRSVLARRLFSFYAWCADFGVAELERLAATVQTWWPQIEAFIDSGVTNAGSEGFNRVAKLVARDAYGFRNAQNQRLRTRCVTTRRGRGHLVPA